ncbi:MAG: translation elongation factor 4 [Saprospiraceae bacterium]|jgi:GTP-binding protein LepA|nr:translation elongation factor 4 [Saprospiraceae bacterium]MDP4698807.1 translation elongation factor 4 [Saprospiraceae bacterium]MDP4814638.1 translation elongation factor 4 [Saprospiraceae bacterium]MDP5049404.1 translation elongation factor 4 [Saprospiraceae bacterium]MDP5088795.1 translation elongation factor 4 [Saprospiraceae bacterium]
MKFIRNFCVIAHIDHGKSTLSDRLMDFTHTIDKRQMKDQALDSMDLERERGITIKSHAVQMYYPHDDGNRYTFNLIDTPGHVDFSYEVSRSIAACEGALLLIDATQGIQAQTISNLYLAIEHDLEIIPVLNKVDMENANIEEVSDQIIDLIGCKKEDIILASGKTGIGVPDIMKAVVDRIPCPKGNSDEPLQALIFDSVFNSFRGVIAYFRIMNGTLKKGDKIRFFYGSREYVADEIGILQINQMPRDVLKTGDVGYVITGIKESKEIKVGDTITHVDRPCNEAIHGFEEVKPMVFAGIFPIDNDDFEDLRDSLEKLQLNDASLVFEAETSQALGFGFRCGFLGMLHLEIIQERLSREFNMEVITTVPNVSYTVTTTNNEKAVVRTPSDLPDPSRISTVEEPYIRAQIITKPDYIGSIMNLCLDKRGILSRQVYLTPYRVELSFELPLAEIVFDFYDRLKSISRGYASFDYALIDYRVSDLIKLDIKLNGENVDALTALVHRDKADYIGRKICKRLKDLLPKQQFVIAIQAAIGAKVIARETISALRKDVTAKCYGGDISRKRKLLEKQKEGKKKMRQIGSVDVPQKAFLEVLKLGND